MVPHPRRALAALGLLLAAPAAATADAVYLKDGFALHGRLKREQSSVTDAETGVSIAVAAPSGSFYVDDGPRVVIFSPRQVRGEDGVAETNIRQGQVALTRPGPFPRQPLPVAATFLKVSPFDDKWLRKFTVRESGIVYDIEQQLTHLTPYYARLSSRRYVWHSWFLTSEFPLPTLKQLLATHPNLAEEPGKPDADRRLTKARFLAQAGWLDEAAKELARAEKDLPGDRERIDEVRKAVRELQADALLEQVERESAGGQHKAAQAGLGRFPAEGLPERVLGRVNTLKVQYETHATQIESAAKHLADLTARAKGGAGATLGEVAAEVREHLSPDTVGRLDTFLTLADQAARDHKAGREPKQTPEQLLALAATGWLMGKSAAEADATAALKLWRARQFLISYLRAPTAAARKDALAGYRQSPDAPGLDELTQLVGTLPPVEPAEAEPGKAVPLTAPGGEDGKGVPYLVRVPPEYNPARPYPVLVALPNIGEKPAQLVAGLGPYADRYGYVLVAPEWADAFQEAYDYAPRCHRAVLDALRDVRRRFQVDSDRVFLYGFAHGATAALDIGLSHPDLFAGAVPMCPAPRLQLLMSYWQNAQTLPLYVVIGDQSGDTPKVLKRAFDEWVPKGYPVLYVVYKGRGTEFYGGELANAFDWMGRKRRPAGWPELGRHSQQLATDESFHALRPTDDRFFWLSSTRFDPKYVKENPGGTTSVLVTARFQGMIRGNQVFVTVNGLRQVTVWLGRGMVDFEKPVEVRVRGVKTVVSNNRGKPLTPSVETMLEDLADRGDRQQLFWVKLAFDNP